MQAVDFFITLHANKNFQRFLFVLYVLCTCRVIWIYIILIFISVCFLLNQQWENVVSLVIECKSLTLLFTCCLSIVMGGVFTHFAVTRQCAPRWGLGENPLPEAEWKGNEHIASLPLSQPVPTSPFIYSIPLIHPRHWTDNLKGHRWPPSPTTPFYVSSTMEKKRQNKPEVVSVFITQGWLRWEASPLLRAFFYHMISTLCELPFFICKGEKLTTISQWI